jgi:hypothetical protein
MSENRETREIASEESPSGLLAILRQGFGPLIREAMEAEITTFLGRSHYQHGAEFRGYRNGYQESSIDSPVGRLKYQRPKVAYATGFKSRFHTPHVRRPEEFSAAVTDMYINGVSTRKVKDSLKAVAGEKVRLGRSTVSRITKKLRQEFQGWKKRSLKDLDVAYLYLDAIRVGMRMGGTGKDAVLVAYAILQDGSTELLAVDSGAERVGSLLGRLCGKLEGPRPAGSAPHLLGWQPWRDQRHRRPLSHGLPAAVPEASLGKHPGCRAKGAPGSGCQAPASHLLWRFLARAGQGLCEEIPDCLQEGVFHGGGAPGKAISISASPSTSSRPITGGGSAPRTSSSAPTRRSGEGSRWWVGTRMSSAASPSSMPSRRNTPLARTSSASGIWSGSCGRSSRERKIEMIEQLSLDLYAA